MLWVRVGTLHVQASKLLHASQPATLGAKIPCHLSFACLYSTIRPLSFIPFMLALCLRLVAPMTHDKKKSTLDHAV